MDIYLIAIGGTGMAPLACLLQELGHRVRGSDAPLYPPTSTILGNAGIVPHTGYDPSHLQPPPDLVIVGNAVPASNPEVQAVEEAGLERLSMPQALHRFCLAGRRPIVVAGTHGKTTTTALAAWVFTSCGTEPGYLIGGAPLDLGRGFAIGSGERFIVEGDEYNAAYFDRGPKFLHYGATTAILTSVEYDHADLYPDHGALLAAFRRLAESLPAGGLLVGHGGSPQLREVANAAGCPVVYYGLGTENDVHPVSGIESSPLGCRFAVDDLEAGRITIRLALAGEHNVLNALAVWVVARRDGLPAADVAAALASFRGVRRRLEELGTRRGITVVDDFAHHPTAVGCSLKALRDRYPGRRIVTLFEPRSLTAGRAIFHRAYREAFLGSDVVLVAPIYHRRRLAVGEALDRAGLAEELRAAGLEATECPTVEGLLAEAVARLRPGDVVVTMSSGSFEGVPQRLLEQLGDS